MINTPPGKPTIRRDGDCIVIHIPMRFKWRGGRQILIFHLSIFNLNASSSAWHPIPGTQTMKEWMAPSWWPVAQGAPGRGT